MNSRVCYLDQLESHTWQITDSVTGTTESCNEYLIVLIAEAHSTILWHVSCDSLVVLLELDSNAFTYGRVGLFGFNTNLVDDDSSGVRRSGEGLLPLSNLMCRLVLLVGPPGIKELEDDSRPLTS